MFSCPAPVKPGHTERVRAHRALRDGFASAHFNGGGHTKGVLCCRTPCHVLFCEMLKIILPPTWQRAALGVAGALGHVSCVQSEGHVLPTSQSPGDNLKRELLEEWEKEREKPGSRASLRTSCFHTRSKARWNNLKRNNLKWNTITPTKANVDVSKARSF